MQIGFIGLGNMGAPMAANLAAAGHTVHGFDPAGTTAAGVHPVTSAEAAVGGSEAVVTMLPDGGVLERVYAEIVPMTTPGTLLLDCSTVDVAAAVAAHERGEAAGHRCADAPVSGGVGGATAGTLTFMVGGSEAAYRGAAPLLDLMGQRRVHCGAGGTGQAAKICNNMLLGISMIGTCEAFALAAKLGLDASRLFDVISASSGSCWSVNTYCPVPGVGPTSPADADYQPGFAAELMLKDLGLSQDAAVQVDAATPLGAHARQLYQCFVDAQGTGRDFSAMFEALSAGKRSDFDA